MMMAAKKVNCWPQPEVSHNEDTMVGHLQLTDQEENQFVAFMETLTDGYTTLYHNSDTVTGRCAATTAGETASTLGNETLTPIWSLAQFPCAADVCGVPPVPNPPIP
jgi:hypothetical protein